MNEAFDAVKRLFVVVPAIMKGHFFDGPYTLNEQVNVFRAPDEKSAIAAYVASRGAKAADGYRGDLLVVELRRSDFKAVSVKLQGILSIPDRLEIRELEWEK